jgi:hypothetical protein
VSAFLLTVLAKGTLGLLLAGAAVRGTRRPAVRHALWSAALAGALLLPVLMATMPALWVPLPSGMLPAPVPLPVPPAPSTGTPAVPWLLLVWAGGAGVLLARLARDLARVRRLTVRADTAVPAALRDALDAVAADLGIAGRVELRVSRAIVEPATWGWRRPVVLLPHGAEGWAASRLRMVFQHELAHVRRGDYLTHLLGQVACALYWPSPAVWYAARCARLEQEHACDAEVIARGAVPHDYARLLLDVARGSTALPRPLGVRMASGGSSLARRVRSVLGQPLGGRASPGLVRVAALGALAAWAPLAQVTAGPGGVGRAAGDAGVSPEGKPPDPALALTLEERAAALSMLASAEEWVRDAGAWALAQEGAPGPRARLTTVALTAPMPRVRMLATTTLRELRQPETVPLWLTALADTCPSVRWNAMRALRDLADPRAFEAVAERLRTDPYPPVRQMAVRAMGRYAGPAAAAALEPALRDSVDGIRTMTRRVLALILPRSARG